MIKMTYKQLGSQDFGVAMRKLTVAELPVGAALSINRVMNEMEKARVVMSKDYKSCLVEEFGERDEEGMLVLADKNDSNSYKFIDDCREQVEEAHKKFAETTFEAKTQPLPFSILASIKLSAVDFRSLEPVLSGVPVE